MEYFFTWCYQWCLNCCHLALFCLFLGLRVAEIELVLDGDRIAIMKTNDIVVPNPAAFVEGAGLPDVIANLNAGHPGLTPGHTGGNVMADLPFKKVWRTFIGGRK